MSSPGSSPPSEQSKSAHPAASRPRPAARQTRSDFYLEPNPFEESFKTPSNVRNSSPQRASSASGDSGKAAPDEPDRPQSRDNPRSSPHRSSSPARPVLPPLASISSPAEASYAWGYSNNSINSLRSGPLSPAMLAGPQTSPDPAPPHLGFDPTTFRTGLTPRTGFTPRTGLTPGTGLTPLVAGFPPSPGTAAFFAIMNGNAASAAAPSGPTITPNTLNAISGVLNGTSPTSSFPHHTTSPSSQPQSDTSNYIPSATSAASSHANGLFLLSQAHQELTKREEAQARANGVAAVPPASTTAAPAATNGASSAPANKRGTKRKSYDMATPPPSAPARAAGKRTRANAKRSISEEFDDDDDDDMSDSAENEPSPPASLNNRRSAKKPETEEEKRRNFLERNRQAALKCRQRKKAWLAQLQAKVEYLSQENERLTAALISSRDEISRLSALVGGAGVVGQVPMPVNVNGVNGNVQPVSMNMNIQKGVNGTAAAVSGPGGGRASGYGY